ncbi:interleukin-15 isoform X1 [Aquarana catesbeiana]|uniref:interleukin-15 isoform X1 n=1 Tax=Aquarana catesbeiana TaxID=8400 RepID=UPI003CC953FF
MYHWTVPIISIILIFSYAIPGWCNGIRMRWMAIGADLKHVYEILQKSKYWNYHKGLKLYTASASRAECGKKSGRRQARDDLECFKISFCSLLLHTDTCRKSILHCYVQELKTVVEEITLIGDEDAAEEITQKIDHIETNGNITFLEKDSCKSCEEYEEKDLEEFIKGFETLTQKMLTL